MYYLQIRGRGSYLVKVLLNIAMSEERVEVLTRIENMFPDIEDELEDRHSSLYGKFKLNFRKEFTNSQPQFYVNAKGISKPFCIRHTNFGIYFALQNGVTLVLSKQPDSQQVQICFGKDIKLVKLSKQGRLISEEEDEQYCGLISSAYQSPLKGKPANSLLGANIYVQNTITYGSFHFRDATAMAFTLAALLVNDLLTSHTPNQIENMVSEVIGYSVCNYSKFQNYHFYNSDMDGDIVSGVSASCSDWKFIISDLLLTEHQSKNISQLNIKGYAELRVLEKLLCQHFKLQSCNIAQLLASKFENLAKQKIDGLKCYSLQQASSFMQEQINLPSDTILEVDKKLLACIEQYSIIHSLTKQVNKQALVQAMRKSFSIKKSANLIPPRVQELINLCIENKAIVCTVIENKYLMVLADKNKIFDLFQLLKEVIFLDEDRKEKVEGGLQRYLFSTLPSRGIGILDPTNEMWFDQ